MNTMEFYTVSTRIAKGNIMSRYEKYYIDPAFSILDKAIEYAKQRILNEYEKFDRYINRGPNAHYRFEDHEYGAVTCGVNNVEIVSFIEEGIYYYKLIGYTEYEEVYTLAECKVKTERYYFEDDDEFHFVPENKSKKRRSTKKLKAD